MPEVIDFPATTRRCRLPFQIPYHNWIEVRLDVSEVEVWSPSLGETVDTIPLVNVVISVWGYRYDCPECLDFTKTSFYGNGLGDPNGYVESEGTVSFPSVGVAVASKLLDQFGSAYLNLPSPGAECWNALQGHQYMQDIAPDAWQKLPDATREAFVEASNETELASAIAAHALLDAETRRLTGRGFDEALTSGTPYEQPDELPAPHYH
jgi:hypothetical protein